jgi:hypothetical protein
MEQFDKRGNGKHQFAGLDFLQFFEKDGDTKSHAEPFIPEDLSDPSVVFWFPAKHCYDIFHMALIKKVSDNSL